MVINRNNFWIQTFSFQRITPDIAVNGFVTILFHGTMSFNTEASLVIINSVNGMIPAQCYAITCTNAESLSIGPVEKISMKLKSKYDNFHSRNINLNLLSASCWPFHSDLDMLIFNGGNYCICNVISRTSCLETPETYFTKVHQISS